MGDVSVLSSARSVNGYDLQGGELFSYVVTVSMASGGTNGDINADLSLNKFDAGVSFNFQVGGKTSNGVVKINVDGVQTSATTSSTIQKQTVREFLLDKTPSLTTGWFFDEGLTQLVTDEYLDQVIDVNTNTNLYCKTASTNGLTFTLLSDNSGYEVSGVSASDTTSEIVIPNLYNGKPVLKIASGTSDQTYIPFYKNKNIKKVYLANTITTIGMYAFRDCTNLESITIPNSVTTIAYKPFRNCSSLKELRIPRSVTQISSPQASGCYNLEKVVVEDGNTIYDSRENCNAIIHTKTNRLISGSKNGFIPFGVVSLAGESFSDCGLRRIYIPGSVTGMDSPFPNSKDLVSIIVDESNAKYDSRNNCNAIIKTSTDELMFGCNTTVMPDGIKIIGHSAFSGSGISSVDIPDSVVEIKDYAFSLCQNLTSIVLPDSVKTIGNSAFLSCINLETINLPDSITSIGTFAFYNCALKEIHISRGLTEISNGAFSHCYYVKEIVIPEGVVSIGDEAFNSCSVANSITIPSSVKSIGKLAFRNNVLVKKIFIPSSVTTILASSYSESPFLKDSNAKIYCEANSKPNGWGNYWNYYDNGATLTATWGVTRAEFDAL